MLSAIKMGGGVSIIPDIRFYRLPDQTRYLIPGRIPDNTSPTAGCKNIVLFCINLPVLMGRLRYSNKASSVQKIQRVNLV